MLRRMLIKEWKEKSNLLIFALAVFLLFSVAFSVYAKDPETLDLLVSTLLLVFPGAFALLLGASGFASEFQDGAWAYLFSRPVKRWRVWLAKCISLLTILYLAILFLTLLIRFHPVLKSAGGTFHFTLIGDKSYGLFVFVVPLGFFMMSFSLSVVSAKPFSVAFLAVLIWMALRLALTMLVGPLLNPRDLPSVLNAETIVGVILPLSFILASFVTLNRADFSQPRSRARTFTISAAVSFLILAVAVSIYAFGVWKPTDERSIYNLQSSADGLYFATTRGVFHFDIDSRETKRIARHRTLWGGISLGGDKIAFVTYHLSGKKRGFAELRIMNNDGSAERTLVGTDDQKSVLYGGHIYPVRVSPQGEKVAFIARDIPKTTTEELWVINSNGTGLRGYDLGIENARFYMGIAFADSGKSLYILFSPRIEPGKDDQRPGVSLVRTDLGSGTTDLIAEGIRRPDLSLLQVAGRISGMGQIVYIAHDEALSKDILTVLDSGSLEKREVQLEDSISCLRLNQAGNRLAFLTSRSGLGVYSLPEQNVVGIRELKGYDLRWPSQALEWTQDNRLILRRIEGTDDYICLLNAELKEQKSIRLPFTTYYHGDILSAGNYVFVKYPARHQLWGVDLETDKWLQIY